MTCFGLLLERALSTVLVEDKHKYSTVQFDLNDDLRQRLIAYGQKIPDDDLAAKGRETNVHITIKYGLHTNDAAAVRDILDGVKSFTVKLGKVSAFYADNQSTKDGVKRSGKDFDVLKIDVVSQALHRLNRRIADALEHTDTHPTYSPHVTIAYLKPGTAADYAGSDEFAGEEMVVDKLIFSNCEGETTTIDLDR